MTPQPPVLKVGLSRKTKWRLPAEAVAEDFQAELERVLGGDALGAHVNALVHSFRTGKPNLAELFAYGMAQLPSDDRRPDDALATFFIVVSELNVCTPDLRIFATNCMEYCESDPLDGWSESLPELRQAYEIFKHELDW